MRVTNHNARFGKRGVFSPKHNDRNFDIESAEHIDPDKGSGNWYWHCFKKAHPEMTFEEAEKRFYEKLFSEGLNQKNQRYKKYGHPERCKTIDDYRTNQNTCPEESIFAVGKKGGTVDSDTLKQIYTEYYTWHKKTFPNVKILNIALHTDEQGAPHIHERKVWVIQDKKGNFTVSQNKALTAMGIKAPKPEKKICPQNNPKMTYTKICREKIQEICKNKGIDLETTPQEPSKTGLDLITYQTRQEQTKLRELQADIEKMASEWNLMSEKVENARTTLNEAQNIMNTIQDSNTKLDILQKQIESAAEELSKILDLKIKASEISKSFFSTKKQVMYDKQMMDKIRDISDEAYIHLLNSATIKNQIAKQQIELNQKEKYLNQKEQKIKPLWDEITRAREDLQEQQKKIKAKILIESKNLVEKLLKEKPAETDVSKKMRDFMSKYTIAGKSMDTLFDEQQAKEKRQQQQNFEQTARRIVNTRDYNLDDLEEPEL